MPKVSVVIPNYNHARYLPQRIESVLGQTYPDLEVLLLDDCSLDNSREVIAAYAARDPRIRVVLNEQNSGSTFRQWNKGIALARGQYVWLAESDDYAAPDFLATLLPRLEADPEVGLAYCDSFSVDEHGELMPTPRWEHFLAELDAQLWKRDFTRPGLALVQQFMSYRNIIPNASAALLRRTLLEQVGPADDSYRLMGDWVYWARLLAVSRVAYVARPLNYFRTHRRNVRSQTRADGTALVETTRLLAELRRHGMPAAEFYEKALHLLFEAWFHAAVYYQVPRYRHQLIYQNMAVLDPAFKARFRRELRQRLLGNRLAGLKMLVGDKLLPRMGLRRPPHQPG